MLGLLGMEHQKLLRVYDSFTRDNSINVPGNAETGQAWTALGTAVWGIISNTLYTSTSPAGQHVLYTESGISNCAVSLTISTNPADPSPGLVFRLSDLNNFLMVQKGAASYVMWKKVNTSYTKIGEYAIAPANGDVVKVTVIGSSISVRINGTERITATEEFNQTATKYGVYNTLYTTPRFDNFQVEAI